MRVQLPSAFPMVPQSIQHWLTVLPKVVPFASNRMPMSQASIKDVDWNEKNNNTLPTITLLLLPTTPIEVSKVVDELRAEIYIDIRLCLYIYSFQASPIHLPVFNQKMWQ